MDKEYIAKIRIKDCPYAKKYGDTLMCMDYVIPCEQNIERNKCAQMLLWERMVLEQLFEKMTDRILYGYDLRYAPARHIVKVNLCVNSFEENKYDSNNSTTSVYSET